jgi:gamma-glutamyltranspeptidase/glutathione hydrolase
VAYHPKVREIGHAILDSGGNAFDAFVAATAAQNVLAEGASSLAGPLGVLLCQGSPDRITYLDADFNDPLNPGWRWSRRMPKDGRAVLVPGAPAGLEAMTAKYGTRSFSELLQPSIRLAEQGFPITRIMSSYIRWRAKILKRSHYGRKTYFAANGQPLQTGQTLRLSEVASFLTHLAVEGARYVYSGPWGKQFLDTVQSRHGVLTQADLDAYRVRWEPPWRCTYRDYSLYTSSSRCYGGLWTFLALKTLEHTSLASETHYSTDPETLGLLVRIARQVWAEGWILDEEILQDRERVEARLTTAYTHKIWSRVQRHVGLVGLGVPASHSYHVITADKFGNVATGVTTIETQPWGEGLFVEGIPLTTAGTIPWSTGPGQRRLCPFTLTIAFDNQRLRFAVSCISNSLVEAAFQFLVNLIDYHLPVEHAVSMPRFGTFPDRRRFSVKTNWIDPGVAAETVKSLRVRGIHFERRGLIDTGLGGALELDAEGHLRGASAPIPYLAHPYRPNPK